MVAVERARRSRRHELRRRRPLRDPRVRRQPHASRLRGRPLRGVRRADGREALRGERHQGHHRGDPGRQRRAAARAGSAAAGRRRCAQASPISRSSPATGWTSEAERRLCEIAAELTDDVTFLGAHAVPQEYEGRADDYVELVCGEMLEACAPLVALDRRLLRAGRLRRGAVTRGARGRPVRRARPARARQPARPRARDSAGGRDGSRLGRPLHLLRRRRHRGARLERHRRHLPPRHGLLDPAAVSRRAQDDRCRRPGGDRDQHESRDRATPPR